MMATSSGGWSDWWLSTIKFELLDEHADDVLSTPWHSLPLALVSTRDNEFQIRVRRTWPYRLDYVYRRVNKVA